ncbi:hypothetical protein [Streptomyces niveus]|uniref:hypothetical protein n=1 Tax=Streptomyces niveus TaxID=193462 RepID=UPI003440D3C0
MLTSTVLVCAGAAFGVGYAAGIVRPLGRLGRSFDDSVARAARQPAEPQPGRRVQHATAVTLTWADILLTVALSPREALKELRAARARAEYSRLLPPEVITAAVAAVLAHRPTDAETFDRMHITVYPSGSFALSNVVLLGANGPRIYLGLGNHRSSCLGEGAEPASLTSTTKDLAEALTRLRPPTGTLVIPLKRS